MTSAHSQRIAAGFGAKAQDYERHAGLQREVAANLAARLPKLARPRVLELGCGTGLLSRHLIARYPDGDFTFTDLSPEMLETARGNLEAAGARMRFTVLDAGAPADLPGFDLIVTSMSLHWLEAPERALAGWRRCLSDQGSLHYAALAPGSFAEWRRSLAAEGLPSGLVPILPLPGAGDSERMLMQEGALGFLRRLKAIGGLTSPQTYAALPPGALRRAMRRLDIEHGGRVTWEIAYGRLSPMEISAAASRSSPSMMPL